MNVGASREPRVRFQTYDGNAPAAMGAVILAAPVDFWAAVKHRLPLFLFKYIGDGGYQDVALARNVVDSAVRPMSDNLGSAEADGHGPMRSP